MNARRWFAGCLLALGLGGCSVELRDGTYGCTGGNCPEGYQCWVSDRRCHLGDEAVDAALRDARVIGGDTSMMPGPDTGIPSSHGAMCSMPEQCSSGDSCIGMACLLPCTVRDQPCSTSETCLPVPPEHGSGFACFDNDCSTTDAQSCARNFACRMVGPAGQQRPMCLPNSW